MPAANSIMNHGMSPNSGFSSSRPRRMRPAREKAAQRQKNKKMLTAMTYHQPTVLVMARLSCVVASTRRSPATLANTIAPMMSAAMSSTDGMKTGLRIVAFLPGLFSGGEGGAGVLVVEDM